MAATLLWNTTYNSTTGAFESTNPYYDSPPTEAVDNPDVLEAKGVVSTANHKGASSFNKSTNVPITLDGATNCYSMLYGATDFNQPLELPTANMCGYMLRGASSFNQTLSLPAAIDCSYILYEAAAFNQPLSLPNATGCGGMLSNATSFNQPLSLPNATVCSYMLDGATAFNQPLELPNAGSCIYMLRGASSFNQPLELPSATNCGYMLSGAKSFNQTLSLPAATNCDGLMNLAVLFNHPVSLPSATSCHMAFNGTSLSAANANAIMSSLPRFTDGSKHIIGFDYSPCCEDPALDISIATSKGWTVSATPTVITLSETEIDFPVAGGTATITAKLPAFVYDGTLVDASSEDQWLNIDRRSSSTFNVSSGTNTTGATRTGTVTFVFKNGTGATTLTVIQSGTATVSISLSPASASVAESGGAVSSTITTSGTTGTLSATPSAEWITAEISGSTLTATVAENTGAARTGTVVVSGAETTETATLTISQAGESIVEEVSILPTTASVVKAGGTVAATVSTNVEPSALTASADADWISSVALTGTALSATVAANATGADRTGTITVATPAGATATLTVTQSGTRARSGLVVFASSAASRTVSVTQVEGADPTSASLAFVPAALDFPAAGGARVFAVANDRAGTLTLGAAPEWLTLTELSEGVYRAVAAKNAPTEARSGTITVSGSNGVSVAVPVSQAGGAGYSLSVSPQSFAFPYDGGSAILTVATDAPSWTPSVSGASTITIARLSSTQLSVNAAARTDGQESTQRAEILIAVTGASATVPVTQEGKPWSGNIPGGNGSAGGTDPDVPISPSRAFERRGASDYFIHRNTCTGGVNSDGGENWTTTLAMPRDKMQRFVASKSLFVGGTWQPVPIPSRNVPIIAGWTITESEPGTATIAIRYLLEAGASVSYQTDGKPAETRTESREGGTFERAFADCNALFAGTELAGSTQIIYERRAQVVEILRKFRAYWGTEEAIEELDEKVAEITNEKYKTAEAVAEAFPRVWGQVRQGLTGYLSYSPTFSITETLNSEPSIDRTGVYSDPPARILELPGTSEGIVAWLLMTDSCTAASNGQFNRTRMWQGAEIINPIYVKGA